MLAGAEYGTGSSRDWAAKGTLLLGVRAVIAASFERIHRSNLVGMGVLPLEFPAGQTWQSLGLTGEETFDIPGLDDDLQPGATLEVVARSSRRPTKQVRLPQRASTRRSSSTTTATAAFCRPCCESCWPIEAAAAGHRVGSAVAAPVPGRPVPGCPGNRRSPRPG